MIITCDKCSTSFNLDDSLVKGNGSNVRCSVCKNIFTAYPPAQESEPELEMEAAADLTFDDEADDGLSLESDMDEGLGLDEAPDDFDMDDSEFSINEPELEIDEPELEMDESGLEMDEPELEMADDDLGTVTEYTEAESEDSELEMDNEFSFEEDELEMQADSSEDDQDQTSQLDFEDDGLAFEADDDDDMDGLEFEPYKEDDDDADSLEDIDFEENEGKLEFEEDDDISSLEFESYQEEESTLEMDNHQGLEMETAGTDDSENTITPLDDSMAEDDEDEFELEFDVEEEETDASRIEMETQPEESESSLTFDEDTAEEGEPPIITPEDDIGEYDEVQNLESDPDTQEEIIGMDDDGEGETLTQDKKPDIQPPPVPRKKRKKKKKSLIGMPVLVLILIFLIVAGAWIASLMTGYKIPYLSDIRIPVIENILNVPQVQEPAPTLTQTEKRDWNGRFIDNTTAGRLFIITGKIQNVSGAPLNHAKVTGILQTKANKVIKSKEVYCGNILSEETLRNADMASIDKQLQTKDGRNKSNVDIKPGAIVDFMIVFDKLSDNLDNFLVKSL